VALASDRNVSTPTAVANLLNSTWTEALSRVNLAEHKIISEFEACLKDSRFVIENSYVSIEKRFTSVLHMFARAEDTLSRALSQIESHIVRTHDIVNESVRTILRGFEGV